MQTTTLTLLPSSIHDYLPLLLLIVVASVLAGVLVGLSWILGPKKPSAAKLAPYECGVTPIGSARERFPVKFYLIAMLFIVFDIETIFLYPWAVTFQGLGKVYDRATNTFVQMHTALQQFSLVEVIIFMVILFVGYIYIWQKGAFEWE